MTHFFSFLLLFVAFQPAIFSAQSYIDLTCSGTGKRGYVPQEDFNKWMQLNAHHFPIDGWLVTPEVKDLTERSEKIAGHYCVEKENNGFGGFAVCNSGAAAYDCVSFVTYNSRMCNWASYCGPHQFEGDCSNIENGKLFGCGEAAYVVGSATSGTGTIDEGVQNTAGVGSSGGGGSSLGDLVYNDYLSSASKGSTTIACVFALSPLFVSGV